MKKVKQEKSFRRSYWPLVVWFDQLAELLAVMKEAGNEVSITVKDYQFDTIEELREQFGVGSLRELKLSITKPFAYLEFSSTWVIAYVSSGPHAPKLFFELDEILSRCQRKPTFLYSQWLLLALGIGEYFLLSSDKFSNSAFDIAILLLAAFLAPWVIWVGFIRTTRTSLIRLQRRFEAKTFVERNKDQLIILLIGALIGGAVTFGGVVLKERFYPSATVAQPKP